MNTRMLITYLYSKKKTNSHKIIFFKDTVYNSNRVFLSLGKNPTKDIQALCGRDL